MYTCCHKQYSHLTEEFHHVSSVQQQQLATRHGVTEMCTSVQVRSHRPLNTRTLYSLVNHVTYKTLCQAVTGTLSPRQHLVVIAIKLKQLR